MGILSFVLVWDFSLRISDNLSVMCQTGLEIASPVAAGRHKFFNHEHWFAQPKNGGEMFFSFTLLILLAQHPIYSQEKTGGKQFYFLSPQKNKKSKLKWEQKCRRCSKFAVNLQEGLWALHSSKSWNPVVGAEGGGRKCHCFMWEKPRVSCIL